MRSTRAPRRHRWSMLTVGLALLLPACAGTDATAPVTPRTAPMLSTIASTGGLVISQVYGGGGNTGAPYTHDYIEIFNAGTASASLAGMSLQYASASGTGNFGASTTQITDLPAVSLAAGQYFLVQQAGSSVGSALPTPDHVDPSPILMSASAGKVALVNSPTTLGCNGSSTPCSASQLTLIVDLVGYGSTANFYEGSGPTPTLNNTSAALREGSGCTDTDRNAADFVASSPFPRNTATTLNPCAPSGPPVVASTVPADAAIDVALAADLSVTFDRPVTVSGAWFGITCSQSGAHTATVSGGPGSYTLNPDADFANSESCDVTITGAQVADQANAANLMAADFQWSFTTIGNVCALPYTSIAAIQGSGLVTPLSNQVVTTQGVVVGDFEGPSPALRGFYLQDPTGDGDPLTSEGIFVFNANANSVALGDVVRVAGQAAEFQGQTQLSNVTSIVACGAGASVTPEVVTLPLPTANHAERWEGMLVRLPQSLLVTEHFQLGRFGQVVLSSGNRLTQPTSIALPGAPAAAVQAANDLNRLIVDDDLNGQNPDPILFGLGGNPLSASNTLRGGDEVTGVTGVLTWTWAGNSASGNAWRVRPVSALGGGLPAFVSTNPRPATPPSVGGTVKVAAFNLLNYYNTFGTCTNGVGGASDPCRGADNQSEFDRQWPKTVAALQGIDADVVGLMELENDGYGPLSAIAHLVDRLNAATAPGTWAFVDADAGTGQVNALGTDGIKVGLLYRPARVTPIGATAALNSVAFVTGGDGAPRNRPALAQAFEDPNGGRFIVSVNHLKSKGSACDAPDALDGQGNCSQVRTNAATMLLGWLAGHPTGIADPDVLIVGDLNSYAMEDPVRALTTGGFTNLIASRPGPQAYSYAFDGQWGYLDHALATATLTVQVTGVAEWHINADEPSVLDYNANFKTAGQQVSLYNADAYRASDHDPVIVGLDLTPSLVSYFGGFLPPLAAPPAVTEARAGSALPVKFSLGGYRGMAILATGYPASRPVNCTTGAPLGALTSAITPGRSGLSYDPATDSYNYVWATDRGWDGSCRELILRFSDGSEVTARIQF